MGFPLRPPPPGVMPRSSAAEGTTPSTSLSAHLPGSAASVSTPAPLAGSTFPPEPQLLTLLTPLADTAGPIATVSTCSGTDALAAQVRARTGALAEAMEGAAVLHIAARLGVPAAELRIISNTCGHRPSQRWDLPKALARLESVVRALASDGPLPPR
jgi:nucleoside phosphorylase